MGKNDLMLAVGIIGGAIASICFILAGALVYLGVTTVEPNDPLQLLGACAGIAAGLVIAGVIIVVVTLTIIADRV